MKKHKKFSKIMAIAMSLLSVFYMSSCSNETQGSDIKTVSVADVQIGTESTVQLAEYISTKTVASETALSKNAQNGKILIAYFSRWGNTEYPDDVDATTSAMHLAASYWGFVLMSVHLGLHWGMIIGMFKKILKGGKFPETAVWIIRAAALAIAVYGLTCFVHADIFSYMFLKNQFVFFDFEQSAVSVFAEYTAMMGCWAFIGYYIAKGIRKLLHKKSEPAK